MREIKFRGKSRKDDQWVYGIPTKDFPIEGAFENIHLDGVKHYRSVCVYPDSIGQFTGICDKNGKEVYEGDTVKTDKYVGTVKWMPGRCCFQIVPGNIYLTKNIEVISE